MTLCLVRVQQRIIMTWTADVPLGQSSSLDLQTGMMREFFIIVLESS